MLRIALLLLCLQFMQVQSVRAGGEAGAQGQQVLESTYLCANGQGVHLTYLFDLAGPALAVMGYQGQQVAMRQTRSASGLRFVALDEQAGLRWHVKGDTGIVLFLAADHTASERVLARDCREAGSRAYRLPH